MSRYGKTGTTSTSDLIKMANRFNIPNFSVHTLEDLPKKLTGVTNMIVNLDRDRGGTHWVCFHYNKKKVCYFDSFGIEFIDDRLLKLLKSTKRPIEVNGRWIQHIRSTNCGLYCIFVLDQLSEGVEFEDIINQFKMGDQIRNEHFLENTPID